MPGLQECFVLRYLHRESMMRIRIQMPQIPFCGFFALTEMDSPDSDLWKLPGSIPAEKVEFEFAFCTPPFMNRNIIYRRSV